MPMDVKKLKLMKNNEKKKVLKKNIEPMNQRILNFLKTDGRAWRPIELEERFQIRNKKYTTAMLSEMHSKGMVDRISLNPLKTYYFAKK